MTATAVDALDATVTPKRVTDRVHYVQGEPGVASRANRGFNSNAGWVSTDDGVVVVDALGTPDLGEVLVRKIRHQTDRPIRRVIVTHYHADHCYGLQALRQAGAEIWAHWRGREYLETQAPARLEQRRRDLAPWVNDRTRLVSADRWLERDESFTLGGVDFDVVYMGPAHAPDDVVVVVRPQNVVFCGDIMITGRIPFVGEADSARWLTTIDRLRALRPRLIIPGHGTASADPARDLEFTREYLTYLRAAMRRAVAEMVPFDEAYAAVDWSRYASLPAFEPANRVNAYGQYLVLERESLKK